MNLLRLIPAAVAALFLTSAAEAAEPTLCTARINGHDVVMGYDKNEARLGDTYSRRELLATRWGKHDCPSYVVLRSLTPELSDEERLPFCLRYDEASESVAGYDLGPRDGWGRCRKTSRSVCNRVNQTTGAAGALTSAAARRSVQGLQALPDGSGAVILSGTGTAISGALASLGGAAAAVAASPVLLTGAAVSVVAVGGTLYACREDE
ncbi:MAG: hypothetical protein FJX25_05625 [Alphaproteobacteria bacterium]|nr:hypothetical protein [Alphaproteobacteria bacterium]